MTKINRTDFLRNVSKRSGMTYAETNHLYDAMIEEIKETMRQGKRLTLTGFGNFYISKHKGHPFQFDKNNGKVEDYVVFKFSSSNALSKEFREDYKAGLLKVVE